MVCFDCRDRQNGTTLVTYACRYKAMEIKGITQGCQMVYFQPKNPNLGKFWMALEWKMFVYITAIWNIYVLPIW
jgi:hypothetical protein